MASMTNRQRRLRLNLIAQRVEGHHDTDTDMVASEDDVIADAKRSRAAHVGLWVAYHRGLQGFDGYNYRRR